MRKFLSIHLFRLTGLTIFLVLTGLILFRTVLSSFYRPVYWILLIFFYVIHFVSQFIAMYTEDKKLLNFGNAYLVSFLFKFMSYLIFLIIYQSVFEDIKLPFVIVFFGLYVVYTLFDIMARVRFSKTSVNKIEKSD